MQTLPKSRLLQFVEEAFQLAQRAVVRYSSKYSKQRYTLHQHVVLLCLKVRKNTTYRTLLDELIEMPRIRRAINLTELPAPSTLCKAFDRLDMTVWRVLLNLSVSLLPTNGVAGDRRFGLHRTHASKHYTKRAKLTIQQLKVTLLVDTRANAILDLHVTTTRIHDTQIAPSLINRNAAEVRVLLGDKGYDDQQIRAMARENEIRPLIKHRECSSLQKAWNARLDSNRYAQRSESETMNSRLNRKYGAFVRSRRWWKQFRELALACIVHTSTEPSNDQYREPACYSIYRLISPEAEGENVSNEGNGQMDPTKLAMGIAFGPLTGTFIGLAIDDIGIGISIGMLLGIALGIAWSLT